MKRRILSLVSCLAICLSICIPLLESLVAADDSPISGVSAHSVGGNWEPGANTVDGKADTQWHSLFRFDWGVSYFVLGRWCDFR